MSRRVSSFAGTITLFVAFLAVFASASPANIPRGELGVERRNNEVEGVPSQSDTTDTTGAFSATHTGQVECFGDQCSIVRILTPFFICIVVWQATYYDVGLGACGQTNKNSDYIVALSKDDFNNKATCGKVRSTPFSGIW